MSINFKRAAGVVLVLVGILMIATMAEAKKYKMSFSGWGVNTGIDTNLDGSRAVSATLGGTGTFGKSASNSLVEIGPVGHEVWHGDSCPTGAFIEIVTTTMVARYENGDLIFFVLDDSEDNPSTMCFSVAPEDFYTVYSTFNLLITGGTGRFEGATGWAIMTSVTYPALQWIGDGWHAAHQATSGSLEGEIF